METAANRALSLPPEVPRPNGWDRQVNEWVNITEDTLGTYEDTRNPKGLGDQEKILPGKKHSTGDLQNDESGVTHVKLPVAAGARGQWEVELWRCVRSTWKTAGQGPKGVCLWKEVPRNYMYKLRWGITIRYVKLLPKVPGIQAHEISIN